MPIDWIIFLKILMAILKILSELPPEVDHRPIANGLADAIENAVNDQGGSKK